MKAGMAVAEYGRGQGVRKAEAKWRIKAVAKVSAEIDTERRF